MMEQEQEFVVRTFEKAFAKQRKKRILLYGVGRNTKAIVDTLRGFNFAGLLDQAKTGQTIYGYKVISEKEIEPDDLVDAIVVIIARESVTDIIYRRIEFLNHQYHIRIYDYKGNDLTESNKCFQLKNIEYWNNSYEGLCREIDEHDIISFDIFDTLVLRQTLIPEDVFEITEQKLKLSGIDIPFAKLRREAEENLAGKCPNLEDIYYILGELLAVGMYAPLDLKYIKDMEIETDIKCMRPRPRVVDAMAYAKSRGKQIYLLSDMYYSSTELNNILLELDIKGYDKIFVSNELKCTKEDKTLYEKYKELISVTDCKCLLHIGDNRRADIVNAKACGIDAYHIYSGYELLMASTLRGLLVDTVSFGKRCILGFIISELFENPFTINGTKGQVSCNNLETFGYVFIAPIMEEFVRWIIDMTDHKGVRNILFSSRDGLLIQKIYLLMCRNPLQNQYLRISRRSVTVASIEATEDIIRLANRRYSGDNFGQFMKSRFGVDIEDEADTNEIPTEAEKIIRKVLQYECEIQKEAELERRNYLGYFKKKDISPETVQDAVIFDFVTSGTVPYYFSKIMKKDVSCVCFATLNLPNDMYSADTDDMFSAYGNIRSYGSETALSKHYLILESILTDERTSFIKIDDSGKEIFVGDGVNQKFSKISEIWDGILRFVRDYMAIYGDILGVLDAELSFADDIFGEAFSRDVTVSDEIKDLFVNDDEYDGVREFSVWG